VGPARPDFSAALLGGCDVALDLAKVISANDSPDAGLGVKRIADFDGLCPFGESS